MTGNLTDFKGKALLIAERGCHVFPLVPRSKKPLTPHGYKDATTDASQIDAWWTDTPDANIGIATGAVSGFIVLDIDGEEGEASMRKLEGEYGPLPATVEILTGGGGRHLYFRHPCTPIANSAGKLGEGLDVRGDGGYVVAPPSIHESKRAYIKSVDSQDKMAEAPAWLLDRITRRNTSFDKAESDVMNFAGAISQSITEGSRNDALTRIAGKLLRHIADPFFVLELCQCVNQARFSPPLEDIEVKRTVNSIAKAELLSRGGKA